MRVGGFVPFTTVDFPGRLAAVVFCQGCAWRCSYCHNPHLQPFDGGTLAWAEVCEELAQRRGFLEAVVFSGGEPTAQAALADAVRDVRAMGFLVGLHTAGIVPARLAALLPLLDWVGLDIKAPLDARYGGVTGRGGSEGPARQSLAALLASGVPFELRTILHGLTDADVGDIQGTLAQMDAPPSRLQPYRPVAPGR